MKRYNVRVLPSAYVDLKEAREWYGVRNKELPKQLKQQVSSTIERIRIMPFANAIRYSSVRIANLNNFPYAIHYLVEESNIVIIAIHHTALNPQKWEERLL